MTLGIETVLYGTVEPIRLGVLKGTSNISINCYSNGKVQWFKEKKKLKHSSNTLKLKNLKMKDSGYYSCHGSLGNNASFIAQSEVLVGGNYFKDK